MQGPDQDVVVRRKERFLGIWLNRTSREFVSVPSYYVMHLSENFSATLTPADLVQYRLGVSSLPFVLDSARDATAQRFASALIGLKNARGLFAERKREVEFLAPNVFRTTFFLPSDIPTGEYRVSVYLFRDADVFRRPDADALDRQGRLFRMDRPRRARLSALLRPGLRGAGAFHRLVRRSDFQKAVADRWDGARPSGYATREIVYAQVPKLPMFYLVGIA